MDGGRVKEGCKERFSDVSELNSLTEYKIFLLVSTNEMKEQDDAEVENKRH